MESCLITDVFKQRQRNFRVEPSHSLHLISGLSYQKYSKNLMQNHYYQTFLIEDELKVLNDKAKFLRKRLLDSRNIDLLLTLNESLKRTFNEKIEQTIGLLRNVLSILLYGTR